MIIFFIKNKSNKNFFLFLSKFWFFPYDLQPKYWYNVNEKSSHSFVGYKNLNQDAKLLLNQVKKYSLNKNSKILDLGCNVGRHLNFLKKFGMV